MNEYIEYAELFWRKLSQHDTMIQWIIPVSIILSALMILWLFITGIAAVRARIFVLQKRIQKLENTIKEQQNED